MAENKAFPEFLKKAPPVLPLAGCAEMICQRLEGTADYQNCITTQNRMWIYPGAWSQQIRLHLIRYRQRAGIAWHVTPHTLLRY